MRRAGRGRSETAAKLETVVRRHSAGAVSRQSSVVQVGDKRENGGRGEGGAGPAPAAAPALLHRHPPAARTQAGAPAPSLQDSPLQEETAAARVAAAAERGGELQREPAATDCRTAGSQVTDLRAYIY